MEWRHRVWSQELAMESGESVLFLNFPLVFVFVIVVVVFRFGGEGVARHFPLVFVCFLFWCRGIAAAEKRGGDDGGVQVENRETRDRGEGVTSRGRLSQG
jgi:hypothetical protein